MLPRTTKLSVFWWEQNNVSSGTVASPSFRIFLLPDILPLWLNQKSFPNNTWYVRTYKMGEKKQKRKESICTHTRAHIYLYTHTKERNMGWGYIPHFCNWGEAIADVSDWVLWEEDSEVAFKFQDIYLGEPLGSTPLERWGRKQRRQRAESSCNAGRLEDHG